MVQVGGAAYCGRAAGVQQSQRCRHGRTAQRRGGHEGVARCGGYWARVLWRGGYAELVCRVDIAAH